MRDGFDSHQQRPRLGDLGHLRGRRKAFERRGEYGVRLSGTAGRLAELGERKRRAEAPTARALLLRDLERSLEGFLRQGGI
jgi:hypothetical protein